MANIRIIKIKPGLAETDAVELYDVERVQVYEDGQLFFQGNNNGPSFYVSPDLVEQIIREVKLTKARRQPAKA
jgi:hypothetical protein